MHSKVYFSFIFCLFLMACNTTPVKHYSKVELNTENTSPQRFILSDGLQISLIPPTGFNLTTEHFGFTQAESFSRIKVYEVEVPYQEYLKSLTAEKLGLYKMQLVEQGDVAIANATCHLSAIKQAIAGTVFDKQILVCGDELSSIVIESSYPESAPKNHKAAMYSAITSLSVNVDNKLRLFTGLPFRLTQTPGYKITKRFRNSVVLESVGNEKNTESNKSTVVISHGVSEGTSVEQLAEHFITRGTAEGSVEVLTRNSTKLNGIPALETTAYVQENNEKYWTRQVVSYQKDRFLLAQTRVVRSGRFDADKMFEALLSYFEFK